MAQVFSEHGYNVCINYLNSEDKALQLCENINSNVKINENCDSLCEDNKNIRAIACKADVSDAKQVKEMFERCIDTFGSVDVLINNAGIAQMKLFTDISECEWDRMMDVHLKGTFLCSQLAATHMLEKKCGKIINIASIWGEIGGSCEVHYSTAKAGIIGFTKALAKELAPSGITVNVISPGAIKTDMLADLSDEDIRWVEDRTPLGRIGSVEDIANMAIYLASDKSDFITGQVLSVNGGFGN